MAIKLSVMLKDQCSDNELKVEIHSDPNWIWLCPDGYSDNQSQNGEGMVVGLELYDGRLRLLVYSDINEQDPQIIDLQNALETNRINT